MDERSYAIYRLLSEEGILAAKTVTVEVRHVLNEWPHHNHQPEHHPGLAFAAHGAAMGKPITALPVPMTVP